MKKNEEVKDNFKIRVAGRTIEFKEGELYVDMRQVKQANTRV